MRTPIIDIPILCCVFYCLLFSLPGTKSGFCRRVIEAEVAAGGVLLTACVGNCLNEALGVLLSSNSSRVQSEVNNNSKNASQKIFVLFMNGK